MFSTKNKPKFAGSRGILLLALLAMLVSLALAACGDTPTSTPVIIPTNQAADTTQAANPATAASTINIDISGFKFNPGEITIPAGTTVVWTNKDGAKHNVIADDRSFESPTLEKGASYSHKFDSAGTVNYYCSFHGSPGQGMIGKLVVTAPQAGSATTAAGLPAASPAAQTSAAQETATTAAATTAAAATTEAATTSEAQPTLVAPATGQVIGAVNFRDDLQLTDQLIINLDALPASPAGRVYFAWLLNSAGNNTANLGQVTPDAAGKVSLKYRDPKNANLLANYDKFVITTEALDPTPSAPSSSVVYNGQLPGPSLVHIRHLLVSFATTPNKIGLEVGMRSQAQELRRQAEFLRDAYQSDDLPAVKLRAEYLVNLIEGSKGQDYGDLNKDGKVENSGDGFGLLKNGDQLGYLDGSKEHALLAAKADGATDDIKLHASHVAITVDNASGWVSAIRDRSLTILKQSDINAVEPLQREILVLANQTLNGVDLKGDGQILPIPGSGGVLTSYQHAQLMAAIPVRAVNATANNTVAAAQTTAAAATAHATHSAPAETTAANGTSTQAATVAPAAAAQGGPGQEIKVDISQFKFGSGTLTIKAGTKVTWTNQDSAPHTVTADNSSWTSDTLQKGQSYSYVFNKPGLVKYHCEIHPNMTATITVV
ncbi:MAG TPA: cupredoxin family copper-binding protein [Chloroflexia bacterium]|nr:cupredoxin family copper-binding protein [Chloroflexia bacterium]